MSLFSSESLARPIVQAPMAGGPSTPALAAAVTTAGGLGFLAAGYKPVDAVAAEIAEVRSALAAGAPFGLNIFAPPGHGRGSGDVTAYAATLSAEVSLGGPGLGTPRWDDDGYAAKVELACRERVPVLSFTFGCPSADVVTALHESAVAVWVTATTPVEARAAVKAGADGIVVQGAEAGGHRGSFDDAYPGDVALLPSLQLVRNEVGDAVPLIAAGGIATGRAVAAVLAAGARAAAVGTAFMLCPEAGTAPAQREVLATSSEPTALTRAFTGRTARGIANRFLCKYTAMAPSAYPEVHHLTAGLRASARERGDADGFHLWAGETYSLALAEPAAEIVTRLGDEAVAALAGALRTLQPGNV